VGPFNTEIDTSAWGEQQDDVHPSWHVLELSDPGAEPCWCPMLLKELPGPPRVLPSGMTPLSADEVQRRREKRDEEDVFLTTFANTHLGCVPTSARIYSMDSKEENLE
jgi:hypothetical protein